MIATACFDDPGPGLDGEPSSSDGESSGAADSTGADADGGTSGTTGASDEGQVTSGEATETDSDDGADETGDPVDCSETEFGALFSPDPFVAASERFTLAGGSNGEAHLVVHRQNGGLVHIELLGDEVLSSTDLDWPFEAPQTLALIQPSDTELLAVASRSTGSDEPLHVASASDRWSPWQPAPLAATWVDNLDVAAHGGTAFAVVEGCTLVGNNECPRFKRLGVAPPGQDWVFDDVRSTLGDGQRTSIAVDGAGTMHALFESECNLYYRSRPLGDPWSDALALSEPSDWCSFERYSDLIVEAGPEGRVHVSAIDPGEQEVVYGVDPEGPADLLPIGEANDRTRHAMVVDPWGTGHLVIADDAGSSYHVPEANTEGTLLAGTEVEGIALAVADDGRMYVSLFDAELDVIRVATRQVCAPQE